MELESFALLWCGSSDLSAIGKLATLKELELWRIMKLEDISFVSSLVNLEVLKLQDLSHIIMLPDLSELHSLRKIVLNNMKIDESSLNEELREMISHY